MSKAILVIDMPNTCAECRLKVDDRLPTSCVFRRWYSLSVNDTHRTNKWCPLKPIPTKQPDIMDTDGDYGFDGGWNEGYNACIDDILGDNNE